MPRVAIASFNVHGGVDGWGRRFDVTAACGALDAEVIVMQENFTPDGEEGVAAQVGRELGYELAEMPFARGWRLDPPARAGPGWSPRRRDHQPAPLRLSRSEPRDRTTRGTFRGHAAEFGSIGVAVLSRLPILRVDELDLGHLPRDWVQRRAVGVELDLAGRPLRVVGVHMSHLVRGSPLQYRRLARLLPAPGVDAVVAGDLNCWGPLVVAMLPGWHRAVRGRTWPAWSPLAQIDHILVRRGAHAEMAEVAAASGSDHRAIRARLVLP
jgi:endonuclease/exonuclease/phosphatase family metal-dependent hydrolase